jgi:DNA-binding response OmpR family regulator/nitrogen-specific signal transduction histidine kinase
MVADITKIKELENKLRKYSKELEKRVDKRTKELAIINEQLKKANEVKSNFLTNVSHELRTPLTSIRSFSEILLDYKNEEESTREEFLKIINEEAERLTRLINDVLDVSKIEAGKVEWKDDFYYIKDIASEALSFILPLASKKSIPIEKEISQNLPPVLVDKDRIVQVFLNLLDNAVKFTDKGKVKIGAKMQDRSILCYVSDSGKGIPEAYQSKIFERFEQVNENLLSGKKVQGTGLGLSICKGIIEHYGGKIWLESQIGKGSTFFFTLPARLRRVKTASEISKISLPDRKKILIIDDDDNIRRFLDFELTRAGYEIIEEFNGKEAINVINNTKPDLIILDILMPWINGYNILEKIRKGSKNSPIPVIILTVLEDKEKAMRLGANYFMNKPINKNILLKKIKQLLNEDEKKLLIIDDDINFTSAVKFYLEKKGYKVYAAYDGEEGTKTCRIVKPDLIILDMLMPKKSGIDTLKSLKEDRLIKNTPVIVLTVNAIENGRTKCLALGAKRYITKKENLGVLLKEIKEVLGNEKEE